MNRNEAANCKTKYELYCKIFNDSGYKRTGESIDVIGGFMEEYLYKIGIYKHNLSMNDLKHAVNTCIEERNWKNYHPEKQVKNDIKYSQSGMTCNKDIRRRQMNKYECLQEQADRCHEEAVVRSDVDLKIFWLNAEKGFRERARDVKLSEVVK